MVSCIVGINRHIDCNSWHVSAGVYGFKSYAPATYGEFNAFLLACFVRKRATGSIVFKPLIPRLFSKSKLNNRLKKITVCNQGPNFYEIADLTKIFDITSRLQEIEIRLAISKIFLHIPPLLK